jgi:hypothetical protein
MRTRAGSARITTFLALSVDRSNIAGIPSGQRTRVRRRAGWLTSDRRACFLWTACRDTPRISAISCHDQPCSRALSTWSASSCSSNLRSAATARSPVRGSELSAAAARAGALSMLSIYVDTSLMSTSVDAENGQSDGPENEQSNGPSRAARSDARRLRCAYEGG